MPATVLGSCCRCTLPLHNVFNFHDVFHVRFSAGATITAINGVASITVILTAPRTVYQLYFRGGWGTGSAQVRA